MPSGPLGRKQSLFLGGLQPPVEGGGVNAGVLVGEGPDGVPPGGLRAFRVLDGPPTMGVLAGQVIHRRDGGAGWIGMPPSGGSDADDWFDLGLLRYLKEIGGAYQSGWRGLYSLRQLPRSWNCAIVDSGNLFACCYGAPDQGVYWIPGAVDGELVPFGVGLPLLTAWTAVCGQLNGANPGIYAAASGGDIYFAASGGNLFVPLGEPPRQWESLAAAPNGDVWATDSLAGDIYVRVGGVGAFVGTGAPGNIWNAVTVRSDGTVYAIAGFGLGVYRWSGAVWVALQTAGLLTYYGLAAASDGLYLSAYGQDIYFAPWADVDAAPGFGVMLRPRQLGYYGMGPQNSRHLSVDPNGRLYACDIGGQIYRSV